MDAAVAKVRRIEIIYNDGKSDIIRQIEPVKYFSDLEAKGLMFCPESKIAFMVSGSRKMVGSQVELLYAYEDMGDGASQILRLDLQIVERNVLYRKRKYDDYFVDVPKRSGPWDRAEVLRFKGVNLCGRGKWKGVASIVKTRSVESVRTFSKSSKGLQFKSTQIPPQRSAYSDLAESVKHLSRGLQDIDNKSGNETEPIGNIVDDSEDVLSDGSSDGPLNPETEIPTSTENTNVTG